MCLVDAKIKETTEDIVCYKVYLSSEGKLRAPFMRFLAPNINEVVNTVLDRAYLHKCGSNNLEYMVNRGFHSFKYFEGLTKELDFWKTYHVRIFKCTIPKGTKYYEGKFAGNSSYCSESIILKEIINI